MKIHNLIEKALVFLGITLLISNALNAIFGFKKILDKPMIVVYELSIMLVVALGMYLYSRQRNRKRQSEQSELKDFEPTITPMTFPLLLLYEDDAPELLLHPGMAVAADFNPEGYTLYSRDGVYEVLNYSSAPVPAVRLQKIGSLDVAVLKERLRACLEADDDIMTQYHERDVLEYLLTPCCSFAEILCWGALTGAIICDSEDSTLPEMADDENPESDIPLVQRISAPGYQGQLRIEHIRRCAAGVQFITAPNLVSSED